MVVEMNLNALLLTIVVGFFFLIGIVIPKFFKSKNKLIFFTTSLTFIIMLFLIFGDLLPEIIEVLDLKSNLKNFYIVLCFSFLGFVLLKILDFFLPEHHHNHQEENDNKEEHNAHLFHIGFITALSLIVHNILEGISIYITGVNDFKLGLIMALSVGCHNLPLGIEISVGLLAEKKKKIQKISILFFLVFSSFLGAFLLFVIGKELSTFLEGILLSLTLGMLLYISLMELLPEIIKNKKQKEIKWGIVFGIVLALILLLL